MIEWISKDSLLDLNVIDNNKEYDVNTSTIFGKIIPGSKIGDIVYSLVPSVNQEIGRFVVESLEDNKAIYRLLETVELSENINDLLGIKGETQYTKLNPVQCQIIRRKSFQANKSFSVVQAVWIAGALHAYNIFYSKINPIYNDFFLNSSEIINLSQEYTENEVHPPRIGQWLNGDHSKSNHNILRARRSGTKVTYRLSSVGEFVDKTKPYGLDLYKIVSYNREFFLVKELIEFVDNEYEDFIMRSKEDEGELIKGEKMLNNSTILYGPPGTGKTYSSILYAVSVIENVEISKLKLEPYAEVKFRYEQYKISEQIQFITFHQSYGYEEFIEGIRAVVDETGNNISYIYEDGIFKSFCNKAKESDKPFVFIIDEINRGNISKIFGELITLVESTKRLGQKEEMEVILPYTKDSFGVPSNVYIIGTMNTADRSIALLDTALRRRFDFIEMLPDEKIFAELGINIIEVDEKILKLDEMLKSINQRIELLFDREHTIGHSFFTKVRQQHAIDDLSNIFKQSIIPLLQEYFYDDYSKIRYILGDHSVNDKNLQFIVEDVVDVSRVFNQYIDLDIPNIRYLINDQAFGNIDSYIKISKGNYEQNY